MSTSVYLVETVGHGLVYVGIADDFAHRWQQHRRSSWWLGEVVVDVVKVYEMPDREAARQMEAAIIRLSNPRYNTAREEAALRRYDAAAERHMEDPDFDPWPVIGIREFDGEGQLVWDLEGTR